MADNQGSGATSMVAIVAIIIIIVAFFLFFTNQGKKTGDVDIVPKASDVNVIERGNNS